MPVPLFRQGDYQIREIALQSEKMEPWESLDVDDSDLPSLLRPCKRQHQAPNQTNISSSQPILQPSSRLSLPQPTPKTPDSQHSLRRLDHPLTSAASPRLIPGPAGAVQAAMLRKTRDNHNSCRGSCGEDPPIPTQEYIRRAVEDGSDEDDGDFKRNPWLCALEFFRQQGMLDGVLPSTSLSSIKKCLNIGQVDQVVGVIKSCTPNGLGGLMMTLKDRTGTIGASIHHKVLSGGEFGKDISVGSVLILQKVAVFAPSQSAHYLNITLSNVVKVICKDSGPPLKQTYPASAIKYTVLNTECRTERGMPQKAFSQDMERTEGIIDKIRQYANVRSAHNDKQKEKGNSFPASSHCSRGSNKNHYAAVEEPLSVRKDASKEAIEKSVRIDIVDDHQMALDGIDKWPKVANQSCSIQQSNGAANTVENNNNEETRRINGVQRQRQPLTLRNSLPEWTDEQLNELFAMDCEDDGSMF
ncbi:hypothetical protein F0562_023979 [Nyssa sinensis]|uniref:Homologous recombination OB-fold protein OB-fold domain-containing protein n=1 Tax=Nyssa sinensis TaxID=561372 RepID=A0A5J5BLX3_9ASTE|nr:hypothetical protein F0562_023979 [Nyssa sinensis]